MPLQDGCSPKLHGPLSVLLRTIWLRFRNLSFRDISAPCTSTLWQHLGDELPDACGQSQGTHCTFSWLHRALRVDGEFAPRCKWWQPRPSDRFQTRIDAYEERLGTTRVLYRVLHACSVYGQCCSMLWRLLCIGSRLPGQLDESPETPRKTPWPFPYQPWGDESRAHPSNSELLILPALYAWTCSRNPCQDLGLSCKFVLLLRNDPHGTERDQCCGELPRRTQSGEM
mmetsp:Transcript_11410/g.21799  ORF Transcript_11410/g.21799 Transcript_11410/m.21799 type:complete len:227 (-) Transcript_11410:527-1207(-)